MNNVKLNKYLFWDVDYDKLDFDKNSRFIIERVLSKGDLSDWHQLNRIYGLQRIKNEVINIKNMDKKTLNFLSIVFNIPKEKFKCYNINQSFQKLWDY